MAEQTKVAYLLGAGATHAELFNLYQKEFNEGTFSDQNSLLISGVSDRVYREAKRHGIFAGKLAGILTSPSLSNIELLLGLLEKNEISSDRLASELKELLKLDISGRLKKRRSDRFVLHRALIELHQKVEARRKESPEKLLGFISLNYDDTIDRAIEIVSGQRPFYGFPGNRRRQQILLLKLHGGFALEYEGERIPIMTPGINKNYLRLPYNFIWGEALLLLVNCDILRVIGCSLSQNDIGLIDLVFKAHLARNEEPLEIQLIDYDSGDNNIAEQFGFFPRVVTATQIEKSLIKDPDIGRRGYGNPFRIWLKAKIERLVEHDHISKHQKARSSYLNRVCA